MLYAGRIVARSNPIALLAMADFMCVYKKVSENISSINLPSKVERISQKKRQHFYAK